MPPHNELRWIEAGYKRFAAEGLAHISINSMAREIGLSRTSFYHHFGDIDEFIDELLEFHLSIGERYYERLARCENYDPDFINLIITEKTGILFHRQLILNRSNHRFAACVASLNGKTGELSFNLWRDKHDLGYLGEEARGLFGILSESWWSRIDVESFTHEKLAALESNISANVLRALSPGRIAPGSKAPD